MPPMIEAGHILIVEDEHALGAALSAAVRRTGHLPTLAASGAAAGEALRRGRWDAVILDIGLPDMSGLEVLARLRERDTGLPVLVITAHATLDHAIHAQKGGATLYLTKPLDLAQLEAALQSLLKSDGGVAAAASAPAPMAAATLIGSAPCLQPVFIGIARACASAVATLITGPTGSGKSLAATIIHAHGGHGGVLETLDCRQVETPVALLSWLEDRTTAGAVALDEITALPAAAQIGMAAWLAGAAAPSPRVLATTRAEAETAGPEFGLQPDLYYALSASVISLPPLHRRSGDIPALAAFFLALRGNGAQVLTAPALAALQSYAWPGNVRELRHALDYAAALSHDGRLFASHLPPHIAAQAQNPLQPSMTAEFDAVLGRWLEGRAEEPYDHLLDALEAAMLRHLLDRHQGKATRLAAAMRLNRATLRQKLRRLGLHREGADEAS